MMGGGRVSDLTGPAPYDRFPAMKKRKGKTTSRAKKAATKPAATRKSAATKRAAPARAASAAKPDPSVEKMGWGWPAFRYPLV